MASAGGNEGGRPRLHPETPSLHGVFTLHTNHNPVSFDSLSPLTDGPPPILPLLPLLPLHLFLCQSTRLTSKSNSVAEGDFGPLILLPLLPQMLVLRHYTQFM